MRTFATEPGSLNPAFFFQLANEIFHLKIRSVSPFALKLVTVKSSEGSGCNIYIYSLSRRFYPKRLTNEEIQAVLPYKIIN